MASSSSSTSPNYTYNVFASFHGKDVRKTLLSHIREQFNRNGITMFNDEAIERSATIAPSLTQAIKESRISIVILSKRYASSGWCLDELVEIMETKKDMGQIVMTIFYGVDPSHVRKQIGDFGIAFNETCERKKPTDKQRQKWSQALNDVGNIEGEDFLRWNNEAAMIKKVAKDVLEKLNATPSKDFDGMVGLEAHLGEMESLLDLDYDGVKIVAITGPSGIGKTTIARALHSILSNRFQLTCFVDNLRGSYPIGLDEYGLKLRLQEQFLSNILNQDGMRICHLGVLKERLRDQRVLIVLDDVNSIKQLEALADETTWFGPGSRIVVTTENKELLQQHGINNTYHVGFPSRVEALEIFCRYAFRKRDPLEGFEKLSEKVTEFCGNLPLGLRVVGASLRGKEDDEWEEVIRRLETIIDHQDIEEVLRVGYESLHENEQSLFLHIAVFFNYKDGDLVKAMFADNSKIDIKHGLKILVDRSLIYMSTKGEIVMHKLLQQVATKAVHREEPWKRRILIDAQEICDVLEGAEGTRAVSGISFDIFDVNEVSISERAFKRMPNLRFLKVYKSRADGNDVLHIPEEMEFPCRLRLLQWDAYPNKFLPPKFRPEYLVELNMEFSHLEYLWHGPQPFTNLKKMDLSASRNLKELPDLSKATNLETLDLRGCMSLVEIPSSFSHLQKLKKLKMSGCKNLQFIPAHMNLASLDSVIMEGCSKLTKFPDISTNIRKLDIAATSVEDVPPSIRLWSRLERLSIRDNRNLKGVITHLPTNLQLVNLSYSGIEKIPDCMKDLHRLQELDISGCTRLASLPELPGSLNNLSADDCESLETVFFHLKHSPDARLTFINNFKLGQQARREIILGSFFRGTALLPGIQVPTEFDHRARGNSLTFPHPAFSRFKVCLVISPNPNKNWEYITSHLLSCRILGKDDDLCPTEQEFGIGDVSKYGAEHLFVFHSSLLDKYMAPAEVRREIVFTFSSQSNAFDIIECGAKILTKPSIEKGAMSWASSHLRLFPPA
ncbi:unnamed protein product [Microthlaspi erraticum]|uniref:ADP-ribosyl cyclase/cyclic ADP-ribose hydrolase n=1 Tax=Microthlaspi erraticum TaxID=1685480 RepID=A0A6D2KL54_9BRAS|nr:unnamed protein product [Microthlaspi erraticum]